MCSYNYVVSLSLSCCRVRTRNMCHVDIKRQPLISMGNTHAAYDWMGGRGGLGTGGARGEGWGWDRMGNEKETVNTDSESDESDSFKRSVCVCVFVNFLS